jgi:predicted dehydrogenase
LHSGTAGATVGVGYQCRERPRAVALPGVHAEVYADGHDVINASDVDAILVTLWDPTHEEYTAIAAGKPVFCEKPLAMSAEGCRRIVDAEMRPVAAWCRLALCALTTKAIWR